MACPVHCMAWMGIRCDGRDDLCDRAPSGVTRSAPLAKRARPTTEQIGWYGGIIFSIFLIGWAIGGICFGIVADHLGRTTTLIVTILIYAVFTGFAALSQDWWHLAIYRFLTALGIGGEWAAGAALVAETWPEEKRAKAAGILQSAWAVGFFYCCVVSTYC